MDLSQSFKSTCRILFGSEIGELGDFEPYLKKMLPAGITAKSAISGKEIHLSRPYYSQNASFIGMDELGTKAPSLNINQIKDLDSILSSLQELSYCGNKNIGTCMNIQKSDSCNDSTDVLCSSEVLTSKYVAHSYGIRQSEHVFGCMLGGEIAFALKSHVIFYSKRCFDSYLCFRSSDLHSCFNCRGSSGLMFSFCQIAKRNMIGNLELPKEKHLALKKKLTSEIAENIRKNKSFPTILELAGGISHG